MACHATQQRPVWAAPSGGPTSAAAAAARRPLAPWRTRHGAAVAVQAARQQQPDGSGSRAAGNKAESPASSSRRRGHVIVSRDSEEDIAAARQRLAAYLQQQGGIGRAQAAELAGELTAKLGAAADQLVLEPLQWFISRGMRPLKAAQLLAHMCKSGSHASILRQWSTWQPVVAANWQLADSCLAAYQQQCKAAKQRPLKGSDSMAVMLSIRPSRYLLLVVADLARKAALLQQQLELTEVGMGELIASGVVLTGTEATLAAAVRWLVSFAGSKEAAVRLAQGLLSYSVAALDSKVAALLAAWAGVLQPEQVRQLAQRAPHVFSCGSSTYAPTAAVLSGWFPQPAELLAVLHTAPAMMVVSATSLQASEAWMTGPPLSLSRQQFLALVRAAPQSFCMNLAAPLAQHKLAFLTQVADVPLARALSKSNLNYLKSSLTALAGRYFLLAEHSVPLPRHADGGISTLTYAILNLPALLQLIRPHDSQQRLPADDDAAVEYLRQWLAAWPETDSGRQWAQPPPAAAADA